MPFTTTNITSSEEIVSSGKSTLLKLLNSLPVLLLTADCLGLLVCMEIALILRLDTVINPLNPVVYGFVLFVLLGLYLADAYHPETQIAGLRTPYRILLGMGFLGIVTSSVIYLSGIWFGYALTEVTTLLLILGIFTAWAVTLRLFAVKWLRSQARQTSCLMLGASENALNLAQLLVKKKELGRLFVLTEPGQDANRLQDAQINCLGQVKDLATWSKTPWCAVIAASNSELSHSQMQSLRQMRLQGVRVYDFPDVYENFYYKLPSFLLQDKWLAFSDGFDLIPGDFRFRIKRFGDIIAAALLLILLLPLMLLVSIAIKLDSPGPVFYSQMRTGLNEVPFRVYKFRSMYQDAEKRGAQWAGEKDPRITRVGRILRLTRLDELPQIWNVLRGDMSLIGPRPERPEFDVNLKKVIPYYEVRYGVKPGITGWAQVIYPYGASVEDAYEKLAYDLYYIKNYSIWLDLAIAFKTIRVVLLGKGR